MELVWSNLFWCVYRLIETAWLKIDRKPFFPGERPPQIDCLVYRCDLYTNFYSNAGKRCEQTESMMGKGSMMAYEHCASDSINIIIASHNAIFCVSTDRETQKIYFIVLNYDNGQEVCWWIWNTAADEPTTILYSCLIYARFTIFFQVCNDCWQGKSYKTYKWVLCCAFFISALQNTTILGL